ncbi:MAG: ComF family protein, partial [Bacteroidetes bacterium]|nr:ComF family protein [Bacteroidota bacterium]
MGLLERIFPPHCLLCGDPGDGGIALCAGCHGDLPRNHHPCVRCAEPLPGTADDLPELRVCGRCLWRPPPYVAIHVPFLYAPPIDWLVRRLKFHGDLAAGRLLGDLLARELTARVDGVDVVVPMPLHRVRLIERGFNQADELARPLVCALKAGRSVGLLERVRATPPQMDLPAQRRRANVRGAFARRYPP